MFKGVFVATVLSFLLIGTGLSAALEFESKQVKTIVDLPAVGWVFHFAASDSAIAIVEQDRKNLRIMTPYGLSVSIPADDGWLFFHLSFASEANMLLTGEFSLAQREEYKWSGRNSHGEVVFGPIFTRSTMTLSPDGRYCYALYDVGNDFNRPEVYDAAGELVASFVSRSGNWDIKIIQDTLLLYRDGGRLTLYSVPGFHESVTYDSIPLAYAELPFSSVSADGSAYAFQSPKEILVVRLTDGLVSRIDKANLDGNTLYPHLLIADSGNPLLVFTAGNGRNYINIFHRNATGYVKTPQVLEVPFKAARNIDSELSFVRDQLCVVNYWLIVDSTVTYQAAVVDLDSDTLMREKIPIVDGLLLSKNTHYEFCTIRLNSLQAIVGSTTIRRKQQ